MAANGWKCHYCNRILKSERGRTQHVNATPACRKKQQEEVLAQAQEEPEPEAEIATQLRRSKRRRTTVEEAVQAAANADKEVQDEVLTLMQQDKEPSESEEEDVPVQLDESEEELEADSEEELDEEEAKEEANTGINMEMRAKFKEYVDEHERHFAPFKESEVTQIRLLDTLKRKRAPLNAYQEVLEWHLKETKVLQAHETLQHTLNYKNRKPLVEELIKRYNLQGLLPKAKKICLPFSKAHVTIPCVDFHDCIVSLLTDPRFQAEDYLFFGDDPLQPPPEQVVWIEDLNTGEAHLKTYEKLVTDPTRQVLLPLVLYIDGATTRQFSDLPVTALKVALGIHKRTTRDQPFAWRNVAYIPQV